MPKTPKCESCEKNPPMPGRKICEECWNRPLVSSNLYATPPAEESIQRCAKKGLIDLGPHGEVIGHKQATKQQWGYGEMVALVETIWPDIPPAGVSFEEVLKMARDARAALLRENDRITAFESGGIPQPENSANAASFKLR